MKKQCVLKNLRSEKGYKVPIDISHNLLNNIRVWCMNSKDKMAYYIAPDVIDCINRDADKHGDIFFIFRNPRGTANPPVLILDGKHVNRIVHEFKRVFEDKYIFDS